MNQRRRPRGGTSGPDSKAKDDLTEQDHAELKEIIARLDDDRTEYIVKSVGWTMIHCATEAGQARAAKLFEAWGEYEKGNDSAIAAIGGAKGLKKAFREFLRDPDPIMRGFFAITLAVIGDQDSKQEIAKLLKAKDVSPKRARNDDEVDFPGFDRGKAAKALGLLGAREYTKEIAKLLGAGGDPSVSKTACFALAKLGAMEHAPDIAKLLGDEFDRGDAAKALAVMGAREYVRDIAKLLRSDSLLDRQDALLSLGILNAKEYEKVIAEHLKDEDDCSAAGVALVLMDSIDYAKDAVDMFEKHPFRWLSNNTFSPIVMDELFKIKQKAEENFKAMKTRTEQR